MNDLERLSDLSALPDRGKVIVGLSGGADSTALAHFLSVKIEKERICCVHVNHMLRGEESERDEAAVKRFCAEHGLRLQLFHEDVRMLASERKMGLEECGREVRYACFAKMIESEKDCIVTAHNADDNAETVLMNLMQGTALGGLCGIPYQRGVIFRPLLRVPRVAIEQYCEENALTYVQDSSNNSDDYTRNRLRHHMLPLMKEINPNFLQNIANMTETLKLEDEFLQQTATELLQAATVPDKAKASKLSLKVLGNSHLSVRRRTVKMFLEQNGSGRLAYKHIQKAALLLKNGQRLTIPGGRQAECSGGVLAVRNMTPAPSWQTAVNLGKNILPAGKVLILQKSAGCDIIKNKKINNLLFNSSFDCATINRDLIARSRKNGDAFVPLNRGVTKTLKSLLQEKEIPFSERNKQVILEHEGKIIFVEGVGVAEEFRVTPQTCHCITIQIEEVE